LRRKRSFWYFNNLNNGTLL